MALHFLRCGAANSGAISDKPTFGGKLLWGQDAALRGTPRPCPSVAQSGMRRFDKWPRSVACVRRFLRPPPAGADTLPITSDAETSRLEPSSLVECANVLASRGAPCCPAATLTTHSKILLVEVARGMQNTHDINEILLDSVEDGPGHHPEAVDIWPNFRTFPAHPRLRRD